MLSVSLLPVVNVVSSSLLKLPFAFREKSFVKPDDEKPGLEASGRTGLRCPDELKKLSQSNGGGPESVAVLPSSWNDSSWTASAPGTTRIASNTAIRTAPGRK